MHDAPERQVPSGLDHLVLYVDDLERSHDFWAGCLGFKHVGTVARTRPDGTPFPPMRFYSGERDGQSFHHNIALTPRAQAGEAVSAKQINHIAIGYSDLASWTKQLTYLESIRVEVENKLLRGTTYSAHVVDPNGYMIELICELDRSLWAGDINASLNKEALPIS